MPEAETEAPADPTTPSPNQADPPSPKRPKLRRLRRDGPGNSQYVLYDSELTDNEREQVETFEDAAADPAAQYAARDLERHIYAGLTERQAQVLRLCTMEGFSPAQVAEALGCSVGAVYELLSQARKRAREALR